MIKEKYKLFKKAESAFLHEIICWLWTLLCDDKISIWDAKLQQYRILEDIYKSDGKLRFTLKGGAHGNKKSV
jgi:hypothetical protein